MASILTYLVSGKCGFIHTFPALLSSLVLFTISCISISAEPIKPLYLPQNASINIEALGRVMASEDVNTIAATARANGSRYEADGNLLLRWSYGKLASFRPPTVKNASADEATFELGGIHKGTIIVNVKYPFNGAYIGSNVYTMQLRRNELSLLQMPPCPIVESLGQTLAFVPHVTGIASSGNILVTYFSSQLLDADEDGSGNFAPFAASLGVDSCQVIGRGYIFSQNERFSVGWRGYFTPLGSQSVLAPLKTLDPSFTELGQEQSLHAVRWVGLSPAELGNGVATDVSDDGTSVGVALSQQIGGRLSAPKAVLWDLKGTMVAIAPKSDQSIAHAINRYHWVIGSLKNRGLDYAFVWKDGRAIKFDHLLRAPHWRFEAAFGFATPTRVFGIGHYRGKAAAFLVDLSQMLR